MLCACVRDRQTNRKRCKIWNDSFYMMACVCVCDAVSGIYLMWGMVWWFVCDMWGNSCMYACVFYVRLRVLYIYSKYVIIVFIIHETVCFEYTKCLVVCLLCLWGCLCYCIIVCVHAHIPMQTFYIQEDCLIFPDILLVDAIVRDQD